jgi:hypothetical protein
MVPGATPSHSLNRHFMAFAIKPLDTRCSRCNINLCNLSFGVRHAAATSTSSRSEPATRHGPRRRRPERAARGRCPQRGQRSNILGGRAAQQPPRAAPASSTAAARFPHARQYRTIARAGRIRTKKGHPRVAFAIWRTAAARLRSCSWRARRRSGRNVRTASSSRTSPRRWC